MSDSEGETDQPAIPQEEGEAKVVASCGGSQPVTEVDTEPVSPSADQCSGDTYMSQQSNDGSEETDCLDKRDTSKQDLGRSTDASAFNSSLEVEMDSPHDTLENVSASPRKAEADDEPTKAEEVLQEDILTEQMDLDSSLSKREIKRKKTSDDPDDVPPSKKPRQDDIVMHDTSDSKQTVEGGVTEETGMKREELAVVNISSTPEKTIVLDDSQEFSLRIEDSSPPSHNSNDKRAETLEDSETWKSHSKEKINSPNAAILSQKSSNSWSSHNNIEQNLSWSSHKCSEEEQVASNGECEVKGQVVTEDILVRVTYVIDEKSNNKIISSKVIAMSLVDHPVEKPLPEKHVRMSTSSTTSYKSSSSGGSVGLPGPFTLPGHTRLSIMSTISSSTNSSGVSCPAWDGPFLIPSAPESKPSMTIACGFCSKVFPPVEQSSCPLPNGSSKPPKEETLVKVSTPKRARKGAAQSPSSGRVKSEMSGNSSKELSTNSEPQACSTPTPTRGRGRPRKHRPESEQTPTKEDAKVNVKMKSDSAAKSTSVSTNLAKQDAGGGAGSQAPVLAKWSDGRYYPGWLPTQPNPNQQSVKVLFCDNQSKMIPVAKVIRADTITAGSLTLATNADGNYEEVLVVEVISENGIPKYKVERGSTTREVEFSCIALLDSQLAELTMTDDQKAKSSLNFNDVSLENILSHPRKRQVKASWRELNSGSSGRKKKQQTSTELATPPPMTSHGNVYEREVFVDTDSSTHSSCNLNLRGNETVPLDVECSPPEISEESSKKLCGYKLGKTFKLKSRKKRLDSGEPEHVVSLHGPIPEEGSQLFVDCVFLITYTDHVTLTDGLPTSALEDASDSHTTSDTENKGLRIHKDRIRTQIKMGGGKVYNTLSQVPKVDLPNTFLITDKPCNTPLYLQSVVNNIPIYQSYLIVQCCQKNIPWKELIGQRNIKRMQAGYSLIKSCLTSPRNLHPFQGKTLLLALSDQLSDLIPFWKDLIKEMGAVVDIYKGEAFRKDYNMVITDPGCDEGLKEQAHEHEVQLVSLVWLQQCIVNGKFCLATEHPLFKYDNLRCSSPEY